MYGLLNRIDKIDINYVNLFLNNFEEIEVYNFGLSSNNKEVAFGIVRDDNRGGKKIIGIWRTKNKRKTP